MIVRFEQIYQRIKDLEYDLEELKRLKAKIPGNRPYSSDLQIAFEKTINGLLNEKIQLEELEVENTSDDLVSEMATVDVGSASKISPKQVSPTPEPSPNEVNLLKFFQEMPKTEIHLHLEASVSRETVEQLLTKNKVAYEKEFLDKLYNFSGLQEFIRLYIFIIDSIRSVEDFELVFESLKEYLERDNIRYAEVHFAPSRMVSNGLDFIEISETLDRLARQCRQGGGPDIKYLVDVSRTFGPENASRNLQRVIKAKCNSIIGIGLGGAENMGPAREYKDVFAQARAEGLRTVAHAGEDDGHWSVRDTVEILQAERIGHATSAIQDPSLVQLLKEKQIPIEACVTSNLCTGKYVRRAEEHPIRHYYDSGLFCTINTDDPEIFDVCLSDEYFKLYKYLNFTPTEILDLVQKGVLATFQANPEEMWDSFQPEIERLRKKYRV